MHPTTPPPPAERFSVLCCHCNREILARAAWCGREVECPHCHGVLGIPAAPPGGQTAIGVPPRHLPKQRFAFPCPRCQSMLESHTGMSGQRGACPTCATPLRIPALNPRTRQPFAAEVLAGEPQDPTPLHAYAASGTQAPQIHRHPDGALTIECPRCHAVSDISAEVCDHCGVPFTLEGAHASRNRAAPAFGIAALTCGVLALPLYQLVFPAALAIVLGLLGLFRQQRPGLDALAVAGAVLGGVALALLAVFH